MTYSAPPQNATPREAMSITLAVPLVEEARALGIDVSQACERGLAHEVARLRKEKWLQENQDALAAWNEYVEQHGLPLSTFRQF